jgi:hypothetical protein
MFDRFEVCEGYRLYDELWGPTEYGARLYKVRYRPACNASLETAEPLAKWIYGRLVRKHERLYVGYERLHRRLKSSPPWPGTAHMRNGARAWLAFNGYLQAVLLYTP